MTFKRKLFTTYLNFFMYIFRQKKFKGTLHINFDTTRLQADDSIDIITIAFNNDYLIENQIKLIKRHITDSNFTHIIADNSTDPKTREKIYNICRKENVAYISLPRNSVTYYVRRACYSHGSAMNWMYHHVIKTRQPKYFGFIDHDIFPSQAYSFKSHIKQSDFYGEKRDLKAGWYLWAGFCLFRFDRIKERKLNFFPCIINKTYLDTGGSNYPALFQSYEMKDEFFCHPPENIRIGPGTEYYIDYIQYIDKTWVHSICAENFDKAQEKKKFMEELFREAR